LVNQIPYNVILNFKTIIIDLNFTTNAID